MYWFPAYLTERSSSFIVSGKKEKSLNWIIDSTRPYQTRKMATLQRTRCVRRILGVLRTHQACMSVAVPAPNTDPDIITTKVGNYFT